MKVFLVAFAFYSCISLEEKLPKHYFSFHLESNFFWEDMEKEYKITKKHFSKRETPISNIVLHHTQDKPFQQFTQESLASNFFFHVGITKNAEVYSFKNPLLLQTRTTLDLDSEAVHIVLEGKEEEILTNQKQIEKAKEIIKKLSQEANVPLNNYDIESKAGIFTHTQVKKKFGHFVELTECGGEKVLQKILTEIGGNYFSEENWKDRFTRNWVARKEKNDPKMKKPFDRGRGITPSPKIELESLEKTPDGTAPENFRLQYTFKQTIQPTCIVLHFTAIPTFQKSQEVLELRGLSASIMIDKDGKAYQLLDSLEDMAQAATGTNEFCIQIEIVGRNTEDLLNNKVQAKKVEEVVLELSKKYSIPLNNYKIESFKGVFSHTQAKKKFGGSVALVGKDFDPGEPYMKLILENLGGKYYEEKDWYERMSDKWIMLFEEFQP
ncbi:MAG: N-acetylmuramoyl-L-alanine amidase [Leptospiraceae bacterium]|nr:N-acetylmuramoyl-L-alanine amidase [Leptospiraceae bacterium]